MIAPGSAVSQGQAVMELETDKAVVEVPSSVSGTVKEVLVKEGDKIKVGQLVFTADSNGASVSDAKTSPPPEEPVKRASEPQPAQRPSNSGAAPAQPQPAPAARSESPAPPRTRSTDPPAATEFRLQELGENISEGD